MIIYKCVITNDEMFSDTFKIKEREDGILIEVEGKLVTRKSTFDDSLICANASAEEAVEGSEDCVTSGVDIVLNHCLKETSYDKKQYKDYMKGYVKAVKEHLEKENPGRVDQFMKDIQTVFKEILGGFKDYQFFTGESMNPDGAMGLLNFRDDDTPYMLFFKDGLLIEKC